MGAMMSRRPPSDGDSSRIVAIPSVCRAIGAQLAETRDARRLTVEQIASELMLSRSQVLGLERADASPFYSPAYFMRGLRKYMTYAGVPDDELNETLAEEGPDGVAIYNSGQLLLEEYYTIGKIARAGLGIATIDANTRLCTATTASSLMESFGADGPPGAYEDFDHAECIVLVGHNAAEQSTVLWMRILAAKAGPLRSKVIVVDPRRTLTVSIGADLHLQLKPGTNVALLNGELIWISSWSSPPA